MKRLEGLLVILLLALVRAYRAASGILGPSGCRFDPSCSRYFEESLRVHGLARGLRYGVGRLLRCHPWGSRWGYDPVPKS